MSLLIRSALSAMLLAVMFAAAPAQPAAAAPVTDAAGAAELGWLRHQASGWDFPVFVPAYGELRSAGVDGVTRGDLAGHDFSWRDPGFQPNYGFASQIDGHYLPLAGGAPGPDGWGWLDAFVTQKLTQDSDATINASDLQLAYGGRRWLRYDFTEPDPQQPNALRHGIACVSLCSQGIASIRFHIVPNELTISYDVMVEQVLGGPLPEMNGGEGASELEPSLPNYPDLPAPAPAPAPPASDSPAPALEDDAGELDGLGLAWILGADLPSLDPALPGELPLSDNWRLTTPPGWTYLLWLPGHGHLRVAGQNGVTADDLGADFDWRDIVNPEGGVLGIAGVVIPDRAMLAGEGAYDERIDRAYRESVLQPGETIHELQHVTYGDSEWLQYELSAPAGNDGGVRHSYVLLSAQGLDLLLISFTFSPPAEPALATIARVLSGTAGLAEMIDQFGGQ